MTLTEVMMIRVIEKKGINNNNWLKLIYVVLELGKVQVY